MDGAKARLKNSLRLRLLVGVAASILIVVIAAIAFSFSAALSEAHELQDDVLRQVAALGDSQRLTTTPLASPYIKRSEQGETYLVIQYLDKRMPGEAEVTRSASFTELRSVLHQNIADGVHSVEVNGEPYRVVVRTNSRGEKLAVAQGTEIRDEIALELAFRSVVPLLILMPILLYVVSRVIALALRPMEVLAKDVDGRSDQDLRAVQHEMVPAEVAPFVNSINRMFGRVSLAMDAQRRFIADAAHELRTPMTALSLQAERLAESEMPEATRQRLTALRAGIERGRSLLDQLLALAKAQSGVARTPVMVSAQAIYRQVLEDLVPIAEKKDIDIGIVGIDDAQVIVDETGLRTILKNLIDNAIRYTRSGGRVDLSWMAQADAVVFSVTDSGPGIPPHELQRVFDPFYRILGTGESGSGLGLSIVQVVAERIGAVVTLGYADPIRATGLVAKVRVSNATCGPG
jgi:two-component system OmpR family sensor kinase